MGDMIKAEYIGGPTETVTIDGIKYYLGVGAVSSNMEEDPLTFSPKEVNTASYPPLKRNSSKYYTPSIEDIRVGYECEVKSNNDRGWVYWKIEQFGTNWNINNIRTPFLTKEQIEAEGWKYHENFDTFSKPIDLESGYHAEFRNGYLMIANTGECIYFGLCPSINEFKTITKLLNF